MKNENNEHIYVNEENYNRVKKKIQKATVVVLIIGLLIGGTLIGIGVRNHISVNKKYSEAGKEARLKELKKEQDELKEQKDKEAENIKKIKAELEEKIKPVEEEIKNLERVNFNGFNDEYYARKDKIEELKKSIKDEKKSIDNIEEVLDVSFNYCSASFVSIDSNVTKYCTIVKKISENQENIDNLDKDYLKTEKLSKISARTIPFYILGIIIIIVTLIATGILYAETKSREIAAYKAQQMIPVGKEIVDDITPTIGNAAGEIAKNISKGINEGLKDNQKKEDKEEK